MKKLTKLTTAISKVTGRTGLKIKQYSPEILMVVGVAGVITTTVLACKATLKLEAIVDQAGDTIEKINEAKEKYANKDEEMYGQYTEEDATKDKLVVYVQTAVKVGRLYGPTVILGAVSVGALLGSHNIMKKRNVAIAAAYKIVDESFKDYRKRVVEELGEKVDLDYEKGLRHEMMDVTTVDEKGKEKTTQQSVETKDVDGYSQYAKFFDDGCANWSKNPEYNLLFLTAQQNYANDLLVARGHVFLNEIYDMLGIPRTQAGSVVGWVLKEENSYIDFGMYDVHHTKTRDFVNGYEHSILLDFNVDGVIWDLI